ncbi:MAG: hypothetical protein ACPLN0_04365 [Candidatus Hydrothermia bacterium]
MKDNYRVIIPRVLLSFFILFFALSQLPWSLQEREITATILIILISILFCQYLILNLLYLFSRPDYKIQEGTLTVKLGNITLKARIEDLSLRNLTEKREYLIFKNCDLSIQKEPFFAKLLLKIPYFFTFSYFAFYSYPLFFSSDKELERFYQFNLNLFEEKVALSLEILNLTGITYPFQDQTP